MYYELINKIYTAVRWNHSSCEDQDAMRSATNYGAFTGYVEALQMMGHKAEGGCDMKDGGCLRIEYLKLNGQVLLKNGEWQKAFWSEFEGKLNK